MTGEIAAITEKPAAFFVRKRGQSPHTSLEQTTQHVNYLSCKRKQLRA